MLHSQTVCSAHIYVYTLCWCVPLDLLYTHVQVVPLQVQLLYIYNHCAYSSVSAVQLQQFSSDPTWWSRQVLHDAAGMLCLPHQHLGCLVLNDWVLYIHRLPVGMCSSCSPRYRSA